jgi:DNA-binding NarL/FixJ family response regulator
MADVVIVSHVSLYREGLIRILSQESDVNVCGQADCLARAIEVLHEVHADVVLVDLASADSLDEIRSLSTVFPYARFLALGVDENPSAIADCAEAGISGYVDRHGSAEALINTIRSTACGELMCSPRIAAALMQRIAKLAAIGYSGRSKPCLTDRELEIVTLVEQGLTNKQIAQQLSIATATVRNHVHNILEKLGARTRGEAAAMVRRSSTL